MVVDRIWFLMVVGLRSPFSLAVDWGLLLFPGGEPQFLGTRPPHMHMTWWLSSQGQRQESLKKHNHGSD